MRVQIIQFQLNGVTEQEYLGVCQQLAQPIADMPGLISKTWLANADTNTYGGVYFWQDQSSMDSYMRSEIVRGIQAHPGLVRITSQDFEAVEELSRVTRGLSAVAI